MLQLAEIGYFPQNEGDSGGVWFPEGDAEEAKIKTLQTLLKVPATGDFDAATRNAVLKNFPAKMVPFMGRGKTKQMIEDIDQIISDLQKRNASDAPKPEDKAEDKAEGDDKDSFLWKYKYHLIIGGAGAAALILAARRGMLGDPSVYTDNPLALYRPVPKGRRFFDPLGVYRPISARAQERQRTMAMRRAQAKWRAKRCVDQETGKLMPGWRYAKGGKCLRVRR